LFCFSQKEKITSSNIISVDNQVCMLCFVCQKREKNNKISYLNSKVHKYMYRKIRPEISKYISQAVVMFCISIQASRRIITGMKRSFLKHELVLVNYLH
jgi:hypothetical protein